MSLRQRPLGRTGLHVSEIGFGALEIGRDWAADVNADPRHPSAEEAARVLNGLLDLGVNLIDTAPAYWHSEDFIGRAIAHRRSEYVLATKVGEHCDPSGSMYDYSAAATHRFIDESLRRLRTDTIDLLQIHSASIEVLERGETLGAMQEVRAAGKARFLGMTGGVNEAVRALEIGGFDSVQVPYNLLNPQARAKLLDLAAASGVAVLLMRPLAGGKLTEKFRNLADENVRATIGEFQTLADDTTGGNLAQLALGSLLADARVTSLLVGSRRLEAVERNLALVGQPLAADVVARAWELADRVSVRAW